MPAWSDSAQNTANTPAAVLTSSEGAPVRKDYEPGVLAPTQKSASELEARDAFNREHPPLKGLVVPYDLRKMELPDTSRYLAIQDTGLLRTMHLHQIERHPVQLSPEEAAQLLAAQLAQGDQGK
jgi:hypothetical protein